MQFLASSSPRRLSLRLNVLRQGFDRGGDPLYCSAANTLSGDRRLAAVVSE